MQIEDVMSTLNELVARLAKLSKKVEEIYAVVLSLREGD